MRGARRAALRAVRLQRQQVLHRVHQQRAVRVAQRLHEQLVRAARPTARRARRRPSARAGSARRASAATRRAPRRAGPASPACLASARTSPRARSILQGRCPDQGAAQLRHERPLPGRRVPALRLGDAVPRRDLPDDDGPVHGAVDVQRRRGVRDAGCDQLLPVQVRHQRVQGIVHGRLPLQAARDLRQRHVWAQAAGRDLLRAPGVPERLLRAGRLLPDELHRRVQTPARSPRRAAPAPTRRPATRIRAAPTWGRRAAAPTVCATATALAIATTPDTSCAAPSCPANQSTLVTGRTCDGRGTCLPAATLACAPYVCNGTTACRAACTVDGDCLAPSICDRQTNRCGNKRRLGQACTDDDQCLTGNYLRRRRLLQQHVVRAVPGVQRGHQRGQLRARADGHGRTARWLSGEPAVRQHGRLQRRRRLPAGRSHACACGTASCTGSTFTPLSHCTGTGMCCARDHVRLLTVRVRRRRLAARAAATDGDCVAPSTCQGRRQPKLRAEAERRDVRGRQTSASAATASTASAAAARAAGRARRATCTGSVGMCANIPAGTAAPAGRAQRLRRAARRARATARAAASWPRPACRAAWPHRAAGRCSSRRRGSGAARAVRQPTATCGRTSATPTTPAARAARRTRTARTARSTARAPAARPGAASRRSARHELRRRPRVQQHLLHRRRLLLQRPRRAGTCRACNLTGSAGTCTDVAAGAAAPTGQCAAAPPCGNTGACNGAGGCQLAAASASCGGRGPCTGRRTSRRHTATAPAVRPASSQSCGAYVCSGSSCHTSCTGNARLRQRLLLQRQCLHQPDRARHGLHVHQPVRQRHCVDGVCCNVASCGACKACNRNGAGTCASVTRACRPPRRVRVERRVRQHRPVRRQRRLRAAAELDDLRFRIVHGDDVSARASHCNGAGACAPAATQSCTPYVCGTSVCLTSCNGDGDCAGGTTATAAAASPSKGLGATCSAGGECTSGHCVDGVCCNAGSCGTCRACNLAGSAGMCANIAAGVTAPPGQCAASAPCGNTGACNGSGGCQQARPRWSAALAVSCVEVDVPAGIALQRHGACAQAATTSCSPYACGGSSCLGGCSTDNQCDAGSFCSARCLRGQAGQRRRPA